MSSEPPVLAAEIPKLFGAHRLRCTRQRLALYEALAATRSHPTADELFREVSRRERDISLATVYNTLEAFCKAGLAQKIPGRGGCARYDATVHHHLHLRDQIDGSVADVPDDLGEQLLAHLPQDVLRQLEAKLGFKIEQVQIELVGRFESPSA